MIRDIATAIVCGVAGLGATLGAVACFVNWSVPLAYYYGMESGSRKLAERKLAEGKLGEGEMLERKNISTFKWYNEGGKPREANLRKFKLKGDARDKECPNCGWQKGEARDKSCPSRVLEKDGY